ncbi:hypothetical protein MTO96_000272 [Rhipicephalus appendiculatus]
MLHTAASYCQSVERMRHNFLSRESGAHMRWRRGSRARLWGVAGGAATRVCTPQRPPAHGRQNPFVEKSDTETAPSSSSCRSFRRFFFFFPPSFALAEWAKQCN